MTPPRPGDVDRLLDAVANRAREGLRVAEDYVRFLGGEGGLAGRLRSMRHGVAELVSRIRGPDVLLSARDVEGDPGRPAENKAGGMSGTSEARTTTEEVALAALKRAEESLRSLAEFAGVEDAGAGAEFERLRYELYELERDVILPARARKKMEGVRLYVLVGPGEPEAVTRAAKAALAGGADAIQLRQKERPDAETLELARSLREIASERGALFIVNDRPDIARLSGADGVHLGHLDIPVREARRLLGPAAVIGRSTHSREDVVRAERDGAGYIGVGPVFPTETKGYRKGKGLELLEAAAKTAGVPWFAIGGITLDNLDEVLGGGAERVAVSAAVAGAPDPESSARVFKERLQARARERAGAEAPGRRRRTGKELGS